jgi:hypothetical protein
MTDKETKPFDPCGQLEDERPADEEELTEEEREEILAEDKRIDNCASRAVAVLAKLAQVPSAGLEQFRDSVFVLIVQTWHGHSWRESKRSKAFAEIERGIRAAWIATPKLTKSERVYLDGNISSQIARWGTLYGPVGWRDVLSKMIEVCGTLSGKNPHPYSRKGRGRRRGDVTNYPLKNFIQSLVQELEIAGGHLTLDVKGQRGSWAKALNELRPLLPTRFIPAAPPLSTIERWLKEAEHAPF